MKINLTIDQEDLKILFTHTGCAYPNMTFKSWAEECRKSYLSYFNNKTLFSNRKYTYSQWVNAQIISIT